MPQSNAHLGSVQHTCFRLARPCRGPVAPRSRLNVLTRAQKTQSPLDKVKSLLGQKEEDEDRFKYDFANSRWVGRYEELTCQFTGVL